MSATDEAVRQVANECEVCHVALHPQDVHSPCDEDCPRFRHKDSDLTHLSGRDFTCDCDHTTCPQHCWECDREEGVNT